MCAITVNLKKKIGNMKPVHGICNGPTVCSLPLDLSPQYKEAGFPYIRLHDTEYPFSYVVDVHSLFPNFSADPEDPSNYDFPLTDDLMEKIYQLGAGVVYRLGASIEHTRKKYYVYPPADFEKWGHICAGIVRHYTQGWANGFYYKNMKHWEIWNEPDLNDQTWCGGTKEQFFQLYTTASKIIKSAAPDIKVGGYAACNPKNKEFFEGFLQAVKREQAPLDFYSWHLYFCDPAVFCDFSRVVREGLEKYGFSDTEIIFDEWNYFDSQWDIVQNPYAAPEQARDAYDRQTTPKAAAFCAAMFDLFQREGVDIASYYDGQPTMRWCGLFDRHGVKNPPFYSFKAYHMLYLLNHKLETIVSQEGVYAMAAGTEEESAILISNYVGDIVPDLLLTGLWPHTKAEFYVLDRSHLLEWDKTEYYSAEKVEQRIALPKESVLLIRLFPDQL